MSTTNNQALVDALSEMGRLETVAELEQRGVKRVRTLKLSRVSRLIEQAINQTVMERTLDAGGAEVGVVLDGARARFDELLRTREALDQSAEAVERERAELEEALEVLRDRPAPTGEIVERRRERIEQNSRRDQLLRASVGEMLYGMSLSLGNEAQQALLSVKDKLGDVCVALAQEERRAALVGEVRSYDEHVDMLERRIAKLVSTLASTERALAQVRALKNVDDGIASIYKVVQGLAVGDEDAERKKALLSDIFRANVELREQLEQAPRTRAGDAREPAPAAARQRASDAADDAGADAA